MRIAHSQKKENELSDRISKVYVLFFAACITAIHSRIVPIKFVDSAEFVLLRSSCSSRHIQNGSNLLQGRCLVKFWLTFTERLANYLNSIRWQKGPVLKQTILSWTHPLVLNALYLGVSLITQTNGLLAPLLVQEFVGKENQGAYLGSLRLWTLMAALLAQVLAGLVSDRITVSWGRRRPVILAGSLGSMLSLAGLGFSTRLTGTAGYTLLFSSSMLLYISFNAALGGLQGLIPDLVPHSKHGRYSGVKTLLELPISLILVALVIAPLLEQRRFEAAIAIVLAVLLFTLLVNLTIHEEPAPKERLPFNAKPFLQAVAMVVIFTTLILGAGKVLRSLEVGLGSEASPIARVIWVGGAGLLLIIAVVILGVWITLRLSLDSHMGGSRQVSYLTTAIQRRLEASFTWWVISRLAFLVGVVNIGTFAVYFIQERLGFEAEQAANPAARLMTLVGIAILVAALPGGWLSDRYGPRRLTAASGLLAALGTGIALTTNQLWLFYACGIIIGVAAGTFYTANWAVGTRLVPTQEAGRFLGIANLAGAGAGAIGAYLGGPLADYFSRSIPQYAGLGYLVLFSLFGLLFLVSTFAILRVTEQRTIVPDSGSLLSESPPAVGER
jgi:MFS family permease